MSAMVVAPAAAARQWTNKLSIMVGLAAFFGAVAGITGAIISSTTAKIPTGPMSVVCISLIVIFSLFFAPQRGLIWQFFRSSVANLAWRIRRNPMCAANREIPAHTHHTKNGWGLFGEQARVAICLPRLQTVVPFPCTELLLPCLRHPHTQLPSQISIRYK